MVREMSAKQRCLVAEKEKRKERLKRQEEKEEDKILHILFLFN
jgi:hypothetical protein